MFSLAFTYGRSKVALCPPAVAYQPYYFYSRYPQKTTMLWNLKNLLTPGSWFMYFLTIICIILCIKLSVYVGKKLGLNTFTEEITLVPFRCLENYVFIDLADFILFFRVTLTENQSRNHLFSNNGFSSSFIQLLWTTFGGFMMYVCAFFLDRIDHILIL